MRSSRGYAANCVDYADEISLDLHNGVSLLRNPLHQLVAAVINRDSLGRQAFIGSVMRMAVKNRIHIEVIDRFRKP